MKYELKISTKDEHIKEICKIFWKIKGFEDKYEFEKKVQDIAEEKELSTAQISQIAKSNSELWVSCSSCDTPFLVKNRSEWLQLIGKEFFFEADCQNCRNSKAEAEGKDALAKLYAQKRLDLEEGFKFQRWTECNGDLIEILIIIADGFNTRAINRELFTPICGVPTFSSSLWKKINKLEELGLIWVEKENPLEIKRTKQGRVKEFHILNKLRKFLYDIRKEEFQNAETILKNKKAEIISEIDSAKSGFIEGRFSPTKDVIIRAHRDYGIRMILEKGRKQFRIQLEER